LDPATAAKAGMWYSKAESINKLTDSSAAKIEKMISGLAHDDKVEDFMSKGSDELYEVIKAYKERLSRLDNLAWNEFSGNLVLFGASFDTVSASKDKFASYYFENLSAQEVSRVLRHFENNIRVTGERFIAFCNEQVTTDIFSFRTFSAIIGQNSTIIRKGQNLEITAGIGFFSRTALPRITVDGKDVALNEEGYAIYKLPVARQSGEHNCRVEIAFTDEYGEKHKIHKNIIYTVY
jgi:hypothetical protein